MSGILKVNKIYTVTHNLSRILLKNRPTFRCLANFVRKIRQHGTPSDKAPLTSFEMSTSISELMSRTLHPKLEGHMWHKPECYAQTCISSEEFPCGTKKLMLFFQPLLSKFGNEEIELHQHVTVVLKQPNVAIVWHDQNYLFKLPYPREA